MAAYEAYGAVQEPVVQERFLMQKFLEFMSHPLLKVLLLHSIRGDTSEFVSCFNRLTEDECPKYSKYKINLYDINQRKYIVQVHSVPIQDNESQIPDEEEGTS